MNVERAEMLHVSLCLPAWERVRMGRVVGVELPFCASATGMAQLWGRGGGGRVVKCGQWVEKGGVDLKEAGAKEV